MSKIIRTGADAVLARVVEYHGFVFTQGVVARDTAQDVRGQTRDVLDQIDVLRAPPGTDQPRRRPARIGPYEPARVSVPGADGAPARACVQAVLADPAYLVEIMLITTK